jgi:hypothetical protein
MCYHGRVFPGETASASQTSYCSYCSYCQVNQHLTEEEAAMVVDNCPYAIYQYQMATMLAEHNQTSAESSLNSSCDMITLHYEPHKGQELGKAQQNYDNLEEEILSTSQNNDNQVPVQSPSSHYVVSSTPSLYNEPTRPSIAQIPQDVPSAYYEVPDITVSRAPDQMEHSQHQTVILSPRSYNGTTPTSQLSNFIENVSAPANDEMLNDFIIPQPEWQNASPCSPTTSPPGAHQHNKAVLWRVDSYEYDPTIQIWMEKTQELVSIPFQDIVDVLNKKREKRQMFYVQNGQQHEEQYRQEQNRQCEEQLEQNEQKEHQTQNHIEDVEERRDSVIKIKYSDEASKKSLNLKQDELGKPTSSSSDSRGLKENYVANFVKQLDNAIAKADANITDDTYKLFTPYENEDLKPKVEQKPKRLSNSERCRLFRENRMKKLKTNEGLLKILEQRNKMLKETEKMLIEKKTHSQKACLKVVQGTL